VRWIFLTLLLLNSLFAGIEWSSKADKRAAFDKSYRVVEGGESLMLLSESVGGAARTVVRGGDVKADRLCMLLGPLDSKLNASKLLEAVQGGRVDSVLVAQAIVKAPNYWVYLAPFDSRKSALNKLKELQSVKVDSYLITQGELANGISLGVFENIDSARRMSKRRKSQGYDVKITELGKEDFEYWVAVMEEYTEGLDAEVSKIMNILDMSFEKRQIFCKSVASEK